jgi:hypothetical protein
MAGAHHGRHIMAGTSWPAHHGRHQSRSFTARCSYPVTGSRPAWRKASAHLPSSEPARGTQLGGCCAAICRITLGGLIRRTHHTIPQPALSLDEFAFDKVKTAL